MLVMIDERPIAYRYELIAPHLTDRELRLWAAAEASVAGPGAVAALARDRPVASHDQTRPTRTGSATTRPMKIKHLFLLKP